MRRRQFTALLGGAAAAWPLALRAQQAMPVIGFLGAPSAAPYVQYVAAIYQGLKEAGYVEGQNVRFEYRWADGHYDRLPALAADLVSRHVAVIVPIGGAPSTVVAKAATSTIPIVFGLAADPVKLGLVGSLNRPGGNVTGVAILGVELEAKRLELLHELVPTSTLIAVLVNPSSAQAETQLQDLSKAARAIGQRVLILKATTERELETAFAALVQERVRRRERAPSTTSNGDICAATNCSLLDHFVGELLSVDRGTSTPSAFRSLEVDDQLKLGRRLHRKVGWLRTF